MKCCVKRECANVADLGDEFPFEVEFVSPSSIWGDFSIESSDGYEFEYGFNVLSDVSLY